MSRLAAHALTLILAFTLAFEGRASTLDGQFQGNLRELKRPKPGWSLWHLHEARRLRRSVANGDQRLNRVLLDLVKSRRNLPPLVRGEALSFLAELAVPSVASQAFGATAGYPDHLSFLGPLRGPGTAQKKPWLYNQDSQAGVFGQTSWRRLTSKRLQASLHNGDILNCTGNCHGALEAWVETAKTQESTLILSSNGPIRAWIDGKELMSWDGERAIRPWQHAHKVLLNKGLHRITVHFGHREATPRFSLRLIDTKDGTLKTSKFVARPQAASVAGFQVLADRIAKPDVTYVSPPELGARLTLHLARDKNALGQAASILAKALEVRPTDPDLWSLVARAQAERPNRAREAWAKTSSLSAGSRSDALAELYALERQHRRDEGALQRCRELTEADPRHPIAVECDVEIHTRGLGAVAGLQRFTELSKGQKRIVELDLLEHELLLNSQQSLRAAKIGLDLTLTLGGHVGLLRRAARIFSQAGQRGPALASAQRALSLRPYCVDLHLTYAELLAGQARDKAGSSSKPDLSRALKALGVARTSQPHAPAIFEARGRLHIEDGSRAVGLDDLDRALDMRPQNQALATWRRSLTSRRTLADDHRVKVADVLAASRNLPLAPEGATVLLDKQVTRYHQNALATKWRQRIIRIDGESAAQQFTSIRLPYTPRVDQLQITEAEVLRPDGTKARPQGISDERNPGKQNGIYTLTAFKNIQLPRLRPGDVIHVQTRQVDVSDRNLFGSHFGGIFPTQDQWPISQAQVIVETQDGQHITSHHQGDGTWTYRAEKVANEDTHMRHTWETKEVPPLRYEPHMPGYSDVGGYVSVSSFKSWPQLVTWYRDFIREQLRLTPELRQTAQRLAQGQSGLQAKVAAIHRWVLKNTRYVGIEFGIHGFKPYSLSEIVRRGYGDCKDKAALFVAMLDAVGVASEFVLIRTRDRGGVPDSPPSLWVFNHAIAYVPGLDTYVDATSELAALGEVPALDQGGKVLRFPLTTGASEELTLGFLPFTPSDKNAYVSSGSITLAPDGSAQATFEESISGTQAASMRALFENQAEQEKRLSGLLAQHYPGATLNSFEVSGLTSDSPAVELRLVAKIPGFARMDGGILSIPIHANPTGVLEQHGQLGTRRHALHLPQLSLERTLTKLRLPKETQITELPPPALLSNPFATYTLKVTQASDQIVVEESLVFKEATIRPDDYPEFRRFLQAVANHRRTRISATVTAEPTKK